MTNKQYALVVYPAWRAEEMCDNLYNYVAGDVSQQFVFNELSEKASKISVLIEEAASLKSKRDISNRKKEMRAVVSDAREFCSGVVFKSVKEAFEEAAEIVELLDEAYERFDCFTEDDCFETVYCTKNGK